ncbi:MAG: hypothetical protein KGQ66_09255 [Acidobacteriota bacterium]|nr:hypothetical protein [Acidobacteriota bacterium]
MSVVLVVILAVVVVGVAVALFGWDRYHRRDSAAGPYKPTDEVFVDPATGQRTRVWYSERTGERDYRPD